MTRNINHPLKLKNPEEQIQPWIAQDTNQHNLIQPSMFSYYQTINPEIISFNPEDVKMEEIRSKKTNVNGLNFFQTLRRYDKKKAHQFSIKRDTNFILKNKRKLVQEFAPKPQQNKNKCILMSTLFIHENSVKSYDQQLSSSVQPINWSLIMESQAQKSKQKHKHKDIQSFLRFQSQKREKQAHRQPIRKQSLTNDVNFGKFEEERFQKMIKIKAGIRRRNLKSASSSRQKAEDTQPSFDEIKQGESFSLKANKLVLIEKREVPKTSYSARTSNSSTKPATIEIIGNKNVMIASKIEHLRTIHSSQKNRPLNKLLNIKGSKAENSKRTKNV